MPTPILVKIPELDPISAGVIDAAADLLVIVDVSDVTRDALGTAKKTNIADVASKINHSWLTGIVADQHIAHSGVSITAGTGLSGGGTIAATRTLNLSLTGLSSITTIDPTDLLMVQTVSDGTPKKITWTAFLDELEAEGVGGGSLEIGVTDITGGTSGRILFHNGSLLGEKTTTGTGSVVLQGGPTLTGQTWLQGGSPVTSTPYFRGTQTWDSTGVTFVGETSDISALDYENDSKLREWYFNAALVLSIGIDGSIDFTNGGSIKFDGADSIERDTDMLLLNNGTIAAYDDGRVAIAGSLTVPSSSAGVPMIVSAASTANSIGFRGTSQSIVLTGYGGDNIAFGTSYGGDVIGFGGGGLTWSMSGALGAPDSAIKHFAAGELTQQYGAQAQRFVIANTYTSSTNKEIVAFDWITHANEFWINSDNGSLGGTVRPLVLASNDVEYLRLASGIVSLRGNDGNGKAISITTIGGAASLLSTDGSGTLYFSGSTYAETVRIGNPLNSAEAVTLSQGVGSPEGVVTGYPGYFYFNRSGGSGTTVYAKQSGSATNTGWVGLGSGGGGGLSPWLVKTTTYTAAAGERIQADTTAGAWTLSLPASPAVGDEVVIEDAKLFWATNNLTISRNGLLINNAAGNYTANVTGGKLSCVYISVGYGWSIK